MNENTQNHTPSTTAIIVMVAATLVTNNTDHATWPVPESTRYIIPHSEQTFSSVGQSLSVKELPVTEDFGQKIGAIYASLLERQEPLGAEFEAVWDKNAAQLYES